MFEHLTWRELKRRIEHAGAEDDDTINSIDVNDCKGEHCNVIVERRHRGIRIRIDLPEEHREQSEG